MVIYEVKVIFKNGAIINHKNIIRINFTTHNTLELDAPRENKCYIYLREHISNIIYEYKNEGEQNDK